MIRNRRRDEWCFAGLAVLLLTLTSGCNSAAGVDSPLVGGSCSGPIDCLDESICLRSSDYPGGMCTVSCRDSLDCPSGSVCIKKKDRVCVLTCGRHDDCRGGYKCDDKDLADDEGRALVCVKD